MVARRLFVIGYDGMNYPLLRRFIDEGVLPTFQALLDRGSLNRLLPTLPAWTPTNWSSLVTGGASGTTQLGGWLVRHKRDPWDKPLTMSWDHAILGGAETLWEIADQAGLKTLITHYPPACWGIPLQHGYVVAPGVHDAPFSYAGGMRYFAVAKDDAQTRVETPGEVMGERTTDEEEVGAPPGSSVVRLAPARAAGWRNVSEGALGCPLAIVAAGGTQSRNQSREQCRERHRRDHEGSDPMIGTEGDPERRRFDVGHRVEPGQAEVSEDDPQCPADDRQDDDLGHELRDHAAAFRA